MKATEREHELHDVVWRAEWDGLWCASLIEKSVEPELGEALLELRACLSADAEFAAEIHQAFAVAKTREKLHSFFHR
jgi:hypothetical protein